MDGVFVSTGRYREKNSKRAKCNDDYPLEGKTSKRLTAAGFFVSGRWGNFDGSGEIDLHMYAFMV
jgi:hypothetical protein